MDESKRSNAGATRSSARRGSAARAAESSEAQGGMTAGSSAISNSANTSTTGRWQAGDRDSAAPEQRSSGAGGGRLAGRIRDTATKQLTTQKDRATEGIGNVVQAVRHSTQQLRDEQHDTAARFIEQAADQIERFSNQLKQKDVGELLDDAQRLARRQPALFIGSAFAVGLLGARFLKSSSERQQQDAGRANFSYDRDRSATYSGATGVGTAAGSRDVPGSERF
jgi:hypothetical protein